MTESPARDIDVVLFDLGGVVVQLGSLRNLFGPQGQADPDRFWKLWIESPTVAAFESGTGTEQEFTAGVVEEFGLEISADRFMANFLAWPQGLFEGITDVLGAIPDDVTTATASNTNALHWNSSFSRMDLHDRFDRHYPSFELGVAKPTSAYFEAILADLDSELGVSADRVGFLDDNQVNVDAARSMGIRAERVQGPTEARFVLTEWRVISAVGRGEGRGRLRRV